MTQHDRIIEYMVENGSITSMEAFSKLGITKLSTRISELIRRGVPIEKKMVSGINRYGVTTKYARYKLN